MAGLAVISPGFPRLRGGVTDHTARLTANWKSWDHEVTVIADLAPPQRLVEQWQKAEIDALLVQYVPFLFGPRGLSAWPQRLLEIARQAQIRTTVFVHEPWVPPTRLPWLILSPLQKRQLGRISSVADEVVTAVPAWRSLLPGESKIVYVGSTLPALANASNNPRWNAPTVFSPLAAGLNWEWIHAAAVAIEAEEGLRVIGSTLEESKNNRSVARWLYPGATWTGRLEPEEVVADLARSRLVLAPFVDGASARRTSIFAALSTGVRVLSSSGPLFDAEFGDKLVTAAESKEQFVEQAVKLWSTQMTDAEQESRLEEYRRRLSPEDLDRRLLQIMLGSRT